MRCFLPPFSVGSKYKHWRLQVFTSLYVIITGLASKLLMMSPIMLASLCLSLKREKLHFLSNEFENCLTVFVLRVLVLASWKSAAYSSSLDSSLWLFPIAPLLPEIFITDQLTMDAFKLPVLMMIKGPFEDLQQPKSKFPISQSNMVITLKDLRRVWKSNKGFFLFFFVRHMNSVIWGRDWLLWSWGARQLINIVKLIITSMMEW